MYSKTTIEQKFTVALLVAIILVVFGFVVVLIVVSL